jgi:hypothetical protein
MRNSTQFFEPTLRILENAFRTLEARVAPPARVQWKDGFVFRYAERTIQQAIVQKLARIISGLHAIRALLGLGLFQEQGVIQRAVDEIEEDVVFLSKGVIEGVLTQRHQQYLDYFYEEEFSDPDDIWGSHKSRGMVSREKIRAQINRDEGDEVSRANATGKILSKAYSGFVHGASPHIMDMYGGNPPRFDVSGEFRHFRGTEHADDALNYFLRAVFAMAFAAMAFGDQELFSSMRAHAAKIEAGMLE